MPARAGSGGIIQRHKKGNKISPSGSTHSGIHAILSIVLNGLKMSDDIANCREIPDDSELVGCGWTLAASTHFLSLPDDKARMQFVKEMLCISDEDYDLVETSTITADFNFHNGVFCHEQKFDAAQTQFVCSALAALLERALTVANDPNLNYDELRRTLVDELKEMFKSCGVLGTLFTESQTQFILRYVSTTFMRPLRLILRQFQQSPYICTGSDVRKVFAPPEPDPLDECVSEYVAGLGVGQQFELPSFDGVFTKEEAEAVMADYAVHMQSVIDARFRALENRIRDLEDELASK